MFNSQSVPSASVASDQNSESPQEALSATLLSQPIPGDFAEPLERLMTALHPQGVVLLLRSTPEVPHNWLSETRIGRHLHQSLLEPVQTDIWPLLPDVWAISLQVEDDIEQPTSSFHVHSLRRALVERLDDEWRQQLAGSPDETVRSHAAATDDAERAVPVPQASLQPSMTELAPSFTITPLSSLRDIDVMEDNISELNALLNIIVNKQLHAQFQPIVNMRDGQIFGYEALIRGPKGGTLRRPGALFRAAEKARMISWFDLACQEQCFARAAELGLRHLLFVNMEAEGLAFLDMHDRPLAARARECGLTPGSIVIEITERQAVDDFPRLMQSLNRLREQGFKIAIDDAGAGYNSLHAIAEIRPDFVKIDRALVRNLDVNGERRALLAALVQYARDIGTHVLGEGAETYEELGTLIDLGVTYGQGYLMGKPNDTFRGVAKETREFITERQRQRVQVSAGRAIMIGGLARAGKALPPNAPLADAASAFYKNPSHTSVVVVEDGYVRGLLMRHSLDHILEMARSAHMENLVPDETVDQWMQTGFLQANEEELAARVARQATTRSDLSMETDIVVVDNSNRYVGVLPMRVLMEAVTTTQENRSRYADPLTGLPNRVPLEQTLSDRLNARVAKPLAILRIDLSELASYNLQYGLAHGDNVLRTLARLIQEAVTSYSTANGKATETPYLAHMGGDDFVLLIDIDGPETLPRLEALCQTLLAGFERHQPTFYTSEHQRNGYYEVVERSGNIRRIPLMVCAIGVLTNRTHRFNSAHQALIEALALVNQAKTSGSKRYLIDTPKAEGGATQRRSA